MDFKPTLPTDDSKPYGDVDVERVAKAVRKGWMFALAYGMSPKGVAHLIRDMWERGAKRTAEFNHLRTVEMPEKIKNTIAEVERFERQTDNRIDTLKGAFARFVRKGTKPAAVIISDTQFDLAFGWHRGMDVCSKQRISDGSRYAFMHSGLPIATAPGMVGPVIVDAATYKALLAIPELGLRER